MTGRTSVTPLVTRETAPLVELLRRGPRTRSQLAEALGLARSTVGVRLDDLAAAGLVVAGGGTSSGGRPAASLHFDAGARSVLAVDLGATHLVVALTDLAGGIRMSHAERVRIDDGPVTVLDRVIEIAATMLADPGTAPLLGVGIGVPGPVEFATGRPVNPPIMPGWDRYDIPEHVGGRLGAPVLVDNDVNVLALGEHATAWSDVDDLLFVKVSTGIGAGIISGGALQRGARGSAGDLGHVRVPFAPGTPPHGAAGADLEALASGPAIAQESTVDGSMTAFLSRVTAGDREAIDLVRQAGRDVGEVVATCVNLLNPSVVVLGGSVARAGEHLLAGVREVVYGRSTPLATEHLTIDHARAGSTGGALGAALLVAGAALTPAS